MILGQGCVGVLTVHKTSSAGQVEMGCRKGWEPLGKAVKTAMGVREPWRASITVAPRWRCGGCTGGCTGDGEATGGVAVDLHRDAKERRGEEDGVLA